MLPRLVADSNVIISAFHRGGKPLAVLELGRQGEVHLCLSPFLVAEVRGVLRSKFGWEELRIRRAFRTLQPRLVHPGRLHLTVAADPDDNRILECAVAAHAAWLVTGDRGLLALGTYEGIRLLTPAAFLEVWADRKRTTP